MSKQPLIDQLDQAISGILKNPDFMPASVDPALAELVRCRVFKEIEFLPLSLPNQLPPPPPSVTVRKPPALPAPFGQWTFNVDIVTRDSIRLLGNAACLQNQTSIRFKRWGFRTTS